MNSSSVCGRMRSASGRPACGSSSGSIARNSPMRPYLAPFAASASLPRRFVQHDRRRHSRVQRLDRASLVGIEIMASAACVDFRRQARAFVADENRRRLAQIGARARFAARGRCAPSSPHKSSRRPFAAARAKPESPSRAAAAAAAPIPPTRAAPWATTGPPCRAWPPRRSRQTPPPTAGSFPRFRDPELPRARPQRRIPAHRARSAQHVVESPRRLAKERGNTLRRLRPGHALEKLVARLQNAATAGCPLRSRSPLAGFAAASRSPDSLTSSASASSPERSASSTSFGPSIPIGSSFAAVRPLPRSAARKAFSHLLSRLVIRWSWRSASGLRERALLQA